MSKKKSKSFLVFPWTVPSLYLNETYRILKDDHLFPDTVTLLKQDLVVFKHPHYIWKTKINVFNCPFLPSLGLWTIDRCLAEYPNLLLQRVARSRWDVKLKIFERLFKGWKASHKHLPVFSDLLGIFSSKKSILNWLIELKLKINKDFHRKWAT